jgi:hypothetical protein
MLLSRINHATFPLPLGVLHARPRPTYEESLTEQRVQAGTRGQASLDALFRSGNTWTVESTEQPVAE